MTQIGFYYWRGRPWPLVRNSKTGQQFIRVSTWLKAELRRDIRRGKIKLWES